MKKIAEKYSLSLDGAWNQKLFLTKVDIRANIISLF